MQTEIILLVILLTLSAFFSGSEIALVQVSRLKTRYLFEKKRKGAKALKKLKDDPHRMLITILICNNLVNVAAAAIATKLAIDIFKSNAVGIATGIMTLLLLVFGEITPKSIATQKYEFFALLVAKPIRFFSIILYPIIILFDLFIKLLNKVFGIKREKPVVTEEELKSYVKTGERVGSIKEIEKEMIHNIFKFDDIDVENIMTPRPDMICINVKSKIKDVLRYFTRLPSYSRYPVYEVSKDNIVGILYVKDIYKYMEKKDFLSSPIAKIMRKPFFVPETKKIDSLLRQFQKRKEHLAIVVDEHGVVSGLVTIEDVLEEIVGEIVDETDKIMPSINKIDKRTWVVLGKADIEDVNKKLKTNFKGDFETFGGFIFTKIGKIPKEKDEIHIDKKFKAIIEDVHNNRIYSVRLIRK